MTKSHNQLRLSHGRWATYEDVEATTKPEPVSFSPGSLDKITAMRNRFEQGKQLFHENDETVPTPKCRTYSDWKDFIAKVS